MWSTDDLSSMTTMHQEVQLNVSSTLTPNERVFLVRKVKKNRSIVTIYVWKEFGEETSAPRVNRMKIFRNV